MIKRMIIKWLKRLDVFAVDDYEYHNSIATESAKVDYSYSEYFFCGTCA